MIRSILNIPKEKLDQLDTQKLSHHERTLLADLVEILSPFEEAADDSQTQQTTTAAYIIPSVLGLKSELRDMRSKFNSKLVSTLRRLSSYEDEDYLILVSILDPRFKLQWCACDTVEFGSFICDIQDAGTDQPTTSPPCFYTNLFDEYANFII